VKSVWALVLPVVQESIVEPNGLVPNEFARRDDKVASEVTQPGPLRGLGWRPGL